MAEKQRNGDRSIAEVRRELDERKRRIESRLTELRTEVDSVLPSVRDVVVRHPLATVGGALAAGFLAGWLLGTPAQRRPSKERGRSDLVGEYVVPIVLAMRKHMDGGLEPEEALRAAVRDHFLTGDTASNDARRRQNFLLLSHVMPLAVDVGLQFVKRLEEDEREAETD